MITHHIQFNALVREPSPATLACLAAIQIDPWGVTTQGQIMVALLNRIAALEKALGDAPPDGFASWEDWLAGRGYSIILEQASEDSRSWQMFDIDGEIGEPYPDYPTALAAAKKEATDE